MIDAQFISMVPAVPADEPLAESIRRVVAENALRQPMTETTIARVEAAVRQLLDASYCRGDIERPHKPLALALPQSRSLEIVDWPETATEAKELWKALQDKLKPGDLSAAWAALCRRAPEFYPPVAMADVPEMVERLARAICRRRLLAQSMDPTYRPDHLARDVDAKWREYIGDAEDVLTELRAPTATMRGSEG